MDKLTIFYNLQETELNQIVGGKKKHGFWHSVGDAIGSYVKGYYEGAFG
ncbi:ComC/BlpC family leader-containing pheromone/bacteriocin [Latilactobacillus sakei]